MTIRRIIGDFMIYHHFNSYINKTNIVNKMIRTKAYYVPRFPTGAGTATQNTTSDTI